MPSGNNPSTNEPTVYQQRRRSPFGLGIPANRPRFVPSDADLEWAARDLNRDATDYDVLTPYPIRGGAPEIDPDPPADLPPALLWPDWTDADRWELGPDPTPDETPDDESDHDADRRAFESAALDALERGLIPADFPDPIARTSLVGRGV